MLRAICSLSWAMPETPAPFIVGASRSGTTLLRLMLDAHPDLAVPPETEFILQVVDLANDDNGRAACAFVERSRHTDAGRTSTSSATSCRRRWRHSSLGTRAMRCEAFT